ncbi:hypothetical protein KY290_016541 [Solanum tuberosum]|uniref:Uncharacterized protein n=1 Tax=Solanum tuberosum TaxID=4113 RepID=A0ABQ7V9N7_SOLTU|nr:hypothetical protein KY284_015823 [Solanum tuberosum]KAH0760468.1 hypothetical protein KY290_016541 [Solanum tuberosum]
MTASLCLRAPGRWSLGDVAMIKSNSNPTIKSSIHRLNFPFSPSTRTAKRAWHKLEDNPPGRYRVEEVKSSSQLVVSVGCPEPVARLN